MCLKSYRPLSSNSALLQSGVSAATVSKAVPVESRLHATPGMTTALAALPRSALGFAVAKRTESGTATTNCGSGRTTTHQASSETLC